MDQFQVNFAPRAERDLKSITFHIARHSSIEISTQRREGAETRGN